MTLRNSEETDSSISPYTVPYYAGVGRKEKFREISLEAFRRDCFKSINAEGLDFAIIWRQKDEAFKGALRSCNKGYQRAAQVRKYFDGNLLSHSA